MNRIETKIRAEKEEGFLPGLDPLSLVTTIGTIDDRLEFLSAGKERSDAEYLQRLKELLGETKPWEQGSKVADSAQMYQIALTLGERSRGDAELTKILIACINSTNDSVAAGAILGSGDRVDNPEVLEAIVARLSSQFLEKKSYLVEDYLKIISNSTDPRICQIMLELYPKLGEYDQHKMQPYLGRFEAPEIEKIMRHAIDDYRPSVAAYQYLARHPSPENLRILSNSVARDFSENTGAALSALISVGTPQALNEGARGLIKSFGARYWTFDHPIRVSERRMGKVLAAVGHGLGLLDDQQYELAKLRANMRISGVALLAAGLECLVKHGGEKDLAFVRKQTKSKDAYRSRAAREALESKK